MTREPKTEKQREHTEQIALELYQSRLRQGKAGDELSDWTKAEKIVQSSIRKILFASKRFLVNLRQPAQEAFKLIAWDTPKWLLFSLPKLEWMKLLAVPLVIAAAGSIITSQVQREANQNAVLKAYFDKIESLAFEQNLLAATSTEGSRVLAQGRTVVTLRELDLSRRKQLIDFLQASGISRMNEDLTKPIISFKEQNLDDLNLRGMNLSNMDFRGAIMRNTNLREAVLGEANLEGAILPNANLKGAYLFEAHLKRTIFFEANLEEANLQNAYLEGANLVNANLERANLQNADLRRAILLKANLESVNLKNAQLEGALLVETNLNGVNNLTHGQLTQAKLCRTTLLDSIDLDPNRNCEELGIDPKTEVPLVP